MTQDGLMNFQSGNEIVDPQSNFLCFLWTVLESTLPFTLTSSNLSFSLICFKAKIIILLTFKCFMLINFWVQMLQSIETYIFLFVLSIKIWKNSKIGYLVWKPQNGIYYYHQMAIMTGLRSSLGHFRLGETQLGRQQSIYIRDSKLLDPVVCFAELV